MAVLLDTRALLWWHEQAQFSFQAGLAVLRARSERTLFVSPISAWEIAVANTKANLLRRPPLRGLSPSDWFETALDSLQATITSMDPTVALEAANIGVSYGSHDPGDCFLIATAHILNAALVTRDAQIIRFAAQNPSYLNIIEC